MDWGVIIGSRVGSRSTRQVDGQAFAAGLPVCLQFAKARQALPALLADISGFWQGRGLAARERVKPESDKTVNARECPKYF